MHSISWLEHSRTRNFLSYRHVDGFNIECTVDPSKRRFSSGHASAPHDRTSRSVGLPTPGFLGLALSEKDHFRVGIKCDRTKAPSRGQGTHSEFVHREKLDDGMDRMVEFRYVCHRQGNRLFCKIRDECARIPFFHLVADPNFTMRIVKERHRDCIRTILTGPCSVKVLFFKCRLTSETQ